MILRGVPGGDEGTQAEQAQYARFEQRRPPLLHQVAD